MPPSRKDFRKLPPRDFSIWYRAIFPVLKTLIRLHYFSFDFRGAKEIPSRGPIIYTPNHAGWFTLDSLLLSLAICEGVGDHRLPYAIIHDTLLNAPGFHQFFKNLGVIPASWMKDPQRLPPKLQAFGIYPEGEEGICKPFWKAYQMAPWKTGFVRLAILKKAKVIPTAIIGGEECLPTSFPLRFLKPLIGAVVPAPLLAFPLPTSWKVIFHKPIDFSIYPETRAQDRAFCEKMARQVRDIVQLTLDLETAQRPLPHYSHRLAELAHHIPLFGHEKQTPLPKKTTQKIRSRPLLKKSIA